RHADLLQIEVHPERVPGVLLYRRIDILDRDAPAVLGVVERDVVLEGVGAGDVVVVAVLPAPDHAARLVLAARDRLEAHLDEAVLELRPGQDAPRERAAAGLLEDVRPARRRWIRAHCPARRTVAGHALPPRSE